jgi:hypothetical protein
MAERSKFQFRLRDLLWAVSLIGVSMALWLPGARLGYSPLRTMSEFPLTLVAILFFLGSGSAFGAAIGCLIGRQVFWIYMGSMVSITSYLVYLLVTPSSF